MPRYFLHIHDDGGEVLDFTGVELPDLESARSEAVVSFLDWTNVRRPRLPSGRVEVVEGYNPNAALVVNFELALLG